jgi:hypothetical protein
MRPYEFPYLVGVKGGGGASRLVQVHILFVQFLPLSLFRLSPFLLARPSFDKTLVRDKQNSENNDKIPEGLYTYILHNSDWAVLRQIVA